MKTNVRERDRLIEIVLAAVCLVAVFAAGYSVAPRPVLCPEPAPAASATASAPKVPEEVEEQLRSLRRDVTGISVSLELQEYRVQRCCLREPPDNGH